MVKRQVPTANLNQIVAAEPRQIESLKQSYELILFLLGGD